jgi:hypothetical protein
MATFLLSPVIFLHQVKALRGRDLLISVVHLSPKVPRQILGRLGCIQIG